MKSIGINDTIIVLSTTYEILNQRWESDKCVTDRYQVFRQEEYKDIFETLNQSCFEELILQIVSENLNKTVLIRLQTLIGINIRIYEQKKNLFNKIDFSALCKIDEQEEFDTRLQLLQNDLNHIQDFEYPTEQEKQILLSETRQEINQLQRERADYMHSRLWIRNNYYEKINTLSRSFLEIINSYFPDEKEESQQAKIAETEVKPLIENPEIEPDMIFRAKKYKEYLLLEQRLIKDKFLDEKLNWISTHENGKPDIKNLIVFLVGLQANGYFLPNRDPRIKQYYGTRFHIKIGQNFEKKRREFLANDYKIIFYDYPF